MCNTGLSLYSEGFDKSCVLNHVSWIFWLSFEFFCFFVETSLFLCSGFLKCLVGQNSKMVKPHKSGTMICGICFRVTRTVFVTDLCCLKQTSDVLTVAAKKKKKFKGEKSEKRGVF